MALSKEKGTKGKTQKETLQIHTQECTGGHVCTYIQSHTTCTPATQHGCVTIELSVHSQDQCHPNQKQRMFCSCIQYQ